MALTTITMTPEELRAIEAAATAPPLERIADLEAENHNLNWALGTEGFYQMATPEEQAEHEKGHADVMANIARMKARKERHDQLVPDGVDYLDHIAALTAQVEQAAQPVAWRYKAVAIVDGERVPVKKVDPHRCEFEITQSEPHDWSHLSYPLDYPKYEDHEPLYPAPPKAVPLTDEQMLDMALAANGDDMTVNGELKYCFRLHELRRFINLALGITPATVEKEGE